MIPRIKHVPNDQQLNAMIQDGMIAKIGVATFGVFCYLSTKQLFDEQPASLATMSKQLGMSEKLVQSALNYLVEMGYAEIAGA
jgi:AraC-like DNA-binding protein